MIDDQLLSYGIEMTETNDEGELPLHTAIKHQTPTRITEIILHTFPKAASVKDEYGFLPIHLAAMYNYPLSMFELLVEYYPQGLEECDPDGLLSIHLAMKYQCSDEVVLFMLKYNNAVYLNPLGRDKVGQVKAFRHHAYIPWCIHTL